MGNIYGNPISISQYPISRARFDSKQISQVNFQKYSERWSISSKYTSNRCVEPELITGLSPVLSISIERFLLLFFIPSPSFTHLIRPAKADLACQDWCNPMAKAIARALLLCAPGRATDPLHDSASRSDDQGRRSVPDEFRAIHRVCCSPTRTRPGRHTAREFHNCSQGSSRHFSHLKSSQSSNRNDTHSVANLSDHSLIMTQIIKLKL